MAVFSLVLDSCGASTCAAVLENGEPVAQAAADGSCNPTGQPKDRALENLARCVAQALDQRLPDTPLSVVYAGVEGCFIGARNQWLSSVLSTHLMGLLSTQSKLIATDTLYGAFRSASDAPGGVLISVNGGILVTAIEPGEKTPGSRAGVHDMTPAFLQGHTLGAKVRDIIERRDPVRLETYLAEKPMAALQVSHLTPLVFEPVVWSILGPELLANVHLAIELAMDKVRDGHIVITGLPQAGAPLFADLDRAYGAQVLQAMDRPLAGMIRLARAGKVF